FMLVRVDKETARQESSTHCCAALETSCRPDERECFGDAPLALRLPTHGVFSIDSASETPRPGQPLLSRLRHFLSAAASSRPRSSWTTGNVFTTSDSRFRVNCSSQAGPTSAQVLSAGACVPSHASTACW